MASQATPLHAGEMADDCLPIAPRCGLAHGHGGFLNLSVEAPELPGTRAEPGKDACLFRQRWPGVTGNVWRKANHQGPVFPGNRSSDGLPVASEILHDALQGHWPRRLGSLRVEDRSTGEQGRCQSDRMS